MSPGRPFAKLTNADGSHIRQPFRVLCETDWADMEEQVKMFGGAQRDRKQDEKFVYRVVTD